MLYIFDCGGVLLKNIDYLERISEKYNILLSILKKDHDKYIYPMMEGYMTTLSYMDHLEKEFDIKIGEDLLYTLFNPSVNEKMIEIVDRIREGGERCVVASNTVGVHVRKIEEMDNCVFSHFDGLYFSHIMKLSKPSHAFYSYILEKEKVKKEDAIFIDDSPFNCIAAEECGIRSFNYREGREKEFISSFL